MTRLAEATLEAGWLMALGAQVERHGLPRAADGGGFVPAVIVGVGKLGGRELTTGSDLDVFVVFDSTGTLPGSPVPDSGTTDGEHPVDARDIRHVAHDGARLRIEDGDQTRTQVSDVQPVGLGVQALIVEP